MVGADKKTRFAFWGAWVLLSLMLTYMIAPVVETHFFPVYSKFKVVEAIEQPEGVLVTFQFEKYRDCDPLGATWYLGSIGPSTNIDSRRPNGVTRNRVTGPGLTSPYLLEGINAEELKNEVIAQVRSQCYLFGRPELPLPWTTISRVYP